jgi:prepilin-type N-terminal cleavage/methylation domain-containing protein
MKLMIGMGTLGAAWVVQIKTNYSLRLSVGRVVPPLHNLQCGFSYVEVLVAMFILAIAIVPAMEAIQSGIQGAGVHESLARQQYALIKRMEEVQAESYGNLLDSAQIAGNALTSSSYSDLAGQTERVIVFLALYDVDADPFTLVDPDNDGDADIYTGDTSNLLWLRVELENSALNLETLVSR